MAPRRGRRRHRRHHRPRAGALGDLVFVELPEVGRDARPRATRGRGRVRQGASDVYAPVAGEITEVNEALVDDPALVNGDPHGRRLVLQDQARRPGASSTA